MRAIRFRVFLVRAKVDMAGFVSFLANAPFDPDIGSGIELLEKDRRFILAKYHEQRNIVDEFTDIYGNVLQNKYLQYLSFKFYVKEVAGGVFELFIEAPPSSFKGFVSALRRAFAIPFSFEASKLDVYGWYLLLQSRTDITRVKVLKAQSSLLNLDDDSSFRIAVESSSNAMAKVEQLVGDHTLVLDKIKVSIYYAHAERLIEITRAYGTSVAGFDSSEEAVRFLSTVSPS